MVVTEFGSEKTMHFPAYVARRNLTPSSPKENIGPWIHSEGHFWYRGSATNQSQEQRLTAFLRQQLEAGNKTLGKTELDGWECVTTWFAMSKYVYHVHHVHQYIYNIMYSCIVYRWISPKTGTARTWWHFEQHVARTYRNRRPDASGVRGKF